ncbi:MAG: stage III sporulation protein AB [Clostridia bacterium]
MIASIATLLACSLFGFVRAERLHERERLLFSLSNDITALRSLMEFSMAPVTELFSSPRLKNKTLFLFLNEKIETGASLKEAWNYAGETDVLPFSDMRSDEIMTLSDFFSNFGKSDMETEKRLMERTIELLSEAHVGAKAEAQKKAKLTKTCGVLIGLCAFIVFL